MFPIQFRYEVIEQRGAFSRIISKHTDELFLLCDHWVPIDSIIYVPGSCTVKAPLDFSLPAGEDSGNYLPLVYSDLGAVSKDQVPSLVLMNRNRSKITLRAVDTYKGFCKLRASAPTLVRSTWVSNRDLEVSRLLRNPGQVGTEFSTYN